MDEYRSFDQILKTPRISMLEAALPHVSERMRKPLALYIKTSEMQRILSDFDKEEVLSACGYEQNTPDPEAMLKAMRAAGGSNSAPQIDQMLQMINLFRTYQKINDLMQQNPELLSFLNNMTNQLSSVSHQNQFSQTADLLKQFGNKDSTDIMGLITQMLKNSR